VERDDGDEVLVKLVVFVEVGVGFLVFSSFLNFIEKFHMDKSPFSGFLFCSLDPIDY
jgi:hypothetical protein